MGIENAKLEGRETAQWLLLEYVWEALLNLDSDPVAAVKRVAAVSLNHANDAPHTKECLAVTDGEHLEAIRMHTIQELEDFWNKVRAKIERRHLR